MDSPDRVAATGLRLAALTLVAFGGLVAIEAADAEATAGVRPIAEVRSMPLHEAERGVAVRVRGVVTFLAREHIPKEAVIVQDATGGVWVSLDRVATAREKPARGSEVEIDGITDRGGFAPTLIAENVRVVGTQPLPVARPVSDERFFSGADTCSRIEVEGILQGFRDDGTQWRLILERSGRRFLASVPKALIEKDPASLVDATLRIAGVATSKFNTRGEFVSPRVSVQSADGLAVVEPPRSPPFEAPRVPLDAIAQFRPEPIGGHRIRTEGTVTFVQPGELLHIQDGPVGIRVHTLSSEPVAVGDRVEVAGFLDRGRDTAGLAEAVVRRTGRGADPQPTAIAPDTILEIIAAAHSSGRVAKPGNYAGCLVQFPARLIDIERTRAGGVLTLVSGESTLQAVLRGEDSARLQQLLPGSEVNVTGIMQIALADAYEDRESWVNPEIARLGLLLRSADDVTVIAAPSWWTPQRLAVALAAVVGVLAAALAWVSALRRQLALQTERVAHEMRTRREAAVEFQATLRERNRLAANLHDTLLQSLAGIRFQLDACRVVSRQGSDDESAEHFTVARRMLDHAAQDLRGSVWALRTMPLPGETFSESLEALVRQFGKTHQTPIAFHIEGPPLEVPNFVAGNLLLVAQEAIHNAIQHGKPSRITLHVTFDPTAGTIDLLVQDDGKGFEQGTEVGPAQGHFGLKGMRERVERLGGSFSIESAAGRGTVVHATVAKRAYDPQLEAVM